MIIYNYIYMCVFVCVCNYRLSTFMLHLKVDINKNILNSNTEYKIRLHIHVSDKIKIEHN